MALATIKKFICGWLINYFTVMMISCWHRVSKRDFIHIDDVVTAYNVVLEKEHLRTMEWIWCRLNSFTEVKEVLQNLMEDGNYKT
jgi:nucleoside-diphosphate-sugar epimerase